MAKSKAEIIQQLQEIAQEFDTKGQGGKGDDIRTLIDELNQGKRDHNTIEIKARVKVEKFDGEATPGKQPVEIKEFITDL